MSYRVRCSACGKIMTLEDDAAGEALVCVACGTRLEAPPPPGAETAGTPAGDDADTDVTEVPGIAGARVFHAGTPKAGPPRRRATDVATVSRNALLAVIGTGLVVIVIAVVLTAWIATGGPSRWSPGSASDNLRRNADLLALKSEAEALAIKGQLPEAHEKYRKLQQLWATRDVQDGLMWDIMERAKVDQDKIYTMLLNRMAPAVPDPRPGTVLSDGTVIPGGPATAPADGTQQEPASPADPSLPTGGYAVPDARPSRSENAAPPETRPARGDRTSEAQPRSAPPQSPSRPATAAIEPPRGKENSPPPNGVSDAEIGEGLRRGVDFLIPQFKDGSLAEQPGLSPSRQAGLEALCVYALLTAGQAIKDARLDVRGEFIKRCVDQLKARDLRSRPGGPQEHLTYARSLRAAALAVHNRPEDRKTLKDDVEWLVAATVDGAYTYDDRFTKGQAWAPPADDRLAPEFGPPAWARRAFQIRPTPSFAPAFAPDDGWAEELGTDHDSASPDSPAVILVHGPHDPRTGRELGMAPQSRYRIPGDTRAPLPNNYPRRTPAPLPTMPKSKMPPGGYGWGGMPDAGPDPGAGVPDSPSAVRFPWDNSNSQYGLLGVWSGAEVGIEVPVRYWKDVERHWATCQLPGGGWGYKAKDVNDTLAMTSGGLASLFVTHDWLAAPTVKDNTGRPPLTRALFKGLEWLEDGDRCVSTPNAATHYFGYDLYGLERVGLASGFKYFGTHDWYRELAAKAVALQGTAGGWGRNPDGSDTLVDTAYTLLFLSRGRHPILMNKLQWDRSEVALVDGKPAPGYWANRPRDLANLTRFASRQLERGLNWQVVSLDVDASDWLDSPVLYVASHQAPGLEDADYEKLRQFVEAGGLIFTHADTGAGAFNRWVPKLVEKICPGRTLDDVPETHPLYNLIYRIGGQRPPLQAASNGARLMLVHSPTDLASAWQQRGEKLYPEPFRLGVNLFLYAAGKADLRNRLSSPFVPEPVLDPEGTTHVARLKYGGNWDPEPGAWPRFRRVFEWKTRLSVEHPPVELKDLRYDPSGDAGQPVAHLTGTAAYAFTEAEVEAVRRFVEAGGLLFVDPCGGAHPFADAVRDTLLNKAFPGTIPEPIPDGHPLLRGAQDGQPLALRARAFVAEAMPDLAPRVRLMQSGKGCVVISDLDVTSSLLGTHTWGILGWEPEAASQLMHNALLWARERRVAPAAGAIR